MQTIFLLSPEAFIKHFPLGLSSFIFVFCTSGSPARFHYSCLNLSSPSALSNKRPYCTSGYNQESGSFTVFFFALWLQRLTEAHSQVKVFLSSKGKMTCEFLTMALNMHLLHLWNSYRLQVVDGLLPWLLTVPPPPPPPFISVVMSRWWAFHRQHTGKSAWSTPTGWVQEELAAIIYFPVLDLSS